MTKPVLFFCLDFNEAAKTSKPMDRFQMREDIRSAITWAVQNEYQLLVREQPAVTALLEAFKEVYEREKKSGHTPECYTVDFTVVPENTSAEDIITQHSPAIVLFLGGTEQTARDFDVFLNLNKNTVLLPMPLTQGVSEALFENNKETLGLSQEQLKAMKNIYLPNVLKPYRKKPQPK